MPQLTDYLKTIDARNEQRTDSLRASIDSIAQSQSLQSLQLQQLTSGSLTFRLEAPPAYQPQQQLLPPPLPLPSIMPSSRYTSAQASIVATPAARSPSPLQQHRQYRQHWRRQQQQEEGQELLEPPKH